MMSQQTNYIVLYEGIIFNVIVKDSITVTAYLSNSGTRGGTLPQLHKHITNKRGKIIEHGT